MQKITGKTSFLAVGSKGTILSLKAVAFVAVTEKIWGWDGDAGGGGSGYCFGKSLFFFTVY